MALVKTGSDYVLIDAGSGGTWEPTAGKLADSLEAAGVKPEQIGKVVLTHAHPDHIWGLIDELDDSLRFPRAEYVVAAREFDFWTSGEAANLKGPIEGIAAGARRVFKAIEARTTRIKPGDEVAPGIAAIDTAGHTPGHISLLMTSGSTSCSSLPMPCRTRTSRSRIPTGTPARIWTVPRLPRAAGTCSAWPRRTSCRCSATIFRFPGWDG